MKTVTRTIMERAARIAACLVLMLLAPLTAGAETVTLTSESGLVTLNDGDVVTGTGGVETRIQVATGATVTLSGVDIYTILNVYENRYEWPAISCLGDAVIILDESTNNRIKSNHYTCPGIHVAQNSTLTIRGSGSLEVSSNGQAPGIGAGWQMPCGNIRIEGGNITAYGGGRVKFEGDESNWFNFTSAIGAANGGDCGDITITGGSITAYGGSKAAAIGGGYDGDCGNITISRGVVHVTAKKKISHDWIEYSIYTIGPGDESSTCGTITIGGVVMEPITNYEFIYAPTDVPYTVSFDANGGTGTMASQQFYSNTPQALNTCTFTRENYVFDYWGVKAAGSRTKFTNGQSVNNLGDITLYAQWTPVIYSIDYILDSGTNANSNPATYTIESKTFTLAEPTRLGYDFVGWTYEGQSTPVKKVTIPQGSTGNKTYMANWKLAPIITLTADFGYWELQDGQTLTGTGGPDTHITIADGATVTLSGANLTTIADDKNHYWAGITCVGDATIILADGTTNNIRSGSSFYPGIYVPAGKTLIIQGGGTLNASSSTAAGIGTIYNGGWCGNIVIDGGIINAAGGWEAAGIGSAARGVCGDITITTGVTSVTVWGGNQAASIGAGRRGSCGTVTIGGAVTGSIYDNPFTYRPADYPPCTVTFTPNGGTGTMDSQTVLKNISSGLNACTFTREEYVFTGWNTKADGSGTAYGNEQSVSFTGDVMLYAQWEYRDAYNVTFDANGGTGTMSGQVFRKYESQSLSACTFNREGYTFVSWNTKADGSGMAYTNEQDITITNDMTLYAQWRETFTVTFDANGGTGTMDNQAFFDGMPQSPSPCIFTAPTGYAFAGWNTEADGSGVAYAAGLDISLTGNITLYAQWREACTVTFDANGGTGTMDNQVFFKNTSHPLPSSSFTRNNYDFVCWNTDADGNGTTYTKGQVLCSVTDMTLYAQWKQQPNPTVMITNGSHPTLKNNDVLSGSARTNNVTINNGATVTLKSVTITPNEENQPAINCKGIATIILCGNNNIDGNLTGICVPGGRLTIRGNGSLTVKGHTSAGIGGSGSSCGDIIITDEVDFVTAKGKSPCIGRKLSLSTVTIGGVETGPISQEEFTYNPSTIYTVSFDANGGLGTMAGQSFCWGKPQSLNACSLSAPEDDSFLGWNTAADGSGTAYTDEQAITITGDMTLYAQWAKELTVTYDANGGAGTMESQVFYGGISQNLNACTFTVPLGCHFAGWNTRANGSGTAYDDGQAITINDNTTLYAQWAMPVWVGNSPVTSANRLDILGDGTMSFDLMNNTLTLNHPTRNVAIRTEGIDLTVKGIYQMSAAAGDVALDVVGGSLTLDGDFTLRGAVNGVQAGGNMNVKGQLRAFGTSGSGIHYAGTDNAWLTLLPGFFGTTQVEMEGGTDALSYTESNVFRIGPDGFVLSEPAGGQVVSGPTYFDIRDAQSESATRAVVTLKGTANGDGTASRPFNINSSDDWTKACADVANGCETAGLYFVLNGSITASAMMGRPDNPFAGVIDGQRRYATVTSAIDKDVEGAALFRFVSGATIKNFCVEGTVSGGAASGGIVGQAVGGTTTIENSVFNGTVIATTGKPAQNFIVGDVASGATVTYTNCLDATNHLWPATGTTAYSLTGVDATLTLTGETGIAWNNAIYAPENATVQFTMSTVSSGEYVATGGTLTKSESNDTYSLVMPAQNVAIMPKNSLKYDITSNITTGGIVRINTKTAAVGTYKISETAEGTPVYVYTEPSTYYLRGELTVKDDDDNEIEVTMYDESLAFFTMPKKPVTVSMTFNKKYSFNATTGELRLLLGEFSTITGGHFDTDVTDHRDEVLKVTAAEGVRFGQASALLFSFFENCTEMDLSNVNTSAMASTLRMFTGCSSLQKLNMTGWDMQQVEDMEGMFENCSSLRELDLSGINVTSVMTEMFDGSGVCKLTLPVGMGITASMRLNQGYNYGYYGGEYHNSGWTILGADGVEVSTKAKDDGVTYGELPAQPTTTTFVWRQMPDDFILELPDGEDNSKTIADWNGVTTSVQLTGRKLWKDGGWNTICLPFEFSDFDDFGNNSELRYLDTESYYDASGKTQWDTYMNEEDGYIYRTGFDATTSTLRLYFEGTDVADAGTPYLVKWDKDTEHPYIENPTFANVTIKKTRNTATSEDGKVTFTGTYDNRTFTAADRSVLFLGDNNTLYYPQADTKIGPNRAYFQLNGIEVGTPNGVKEFKLNFGDEDSADGIENVQCSMFNVQCNDAWYDLSGRRLGGKPTQKGIYINNGIKVAIK